MKIDEKREHVLTNFKAMKNQGRIIESDHNPVFLNLCLTFSKAINERITVYQFKNKKSQEMFKTLTTNTDEFTSCFSDFKTHIKKYHVSSQVNTCESCEIIFKTADNLKTHNENKHSRLRTFKCEYCGDNFESECNFKLHMEKHHDEEKIVECEICNKTFKSNFEKQAMLWRDTLDIYFKKCFKKVRISNKPKGKTEEINNLMEKRRELLRK